MRLVPTEVALVLLVACGGAGFGPGAAPDSPVTSSPIHPSSPIPSPTPRIVEPRGGLVDVRPQPWDGFEKIGPRKLQVSFYGGVEACFGVDRVEVDEAAEAVTVTLYAGRVADAEVCIEIAELQAVRVHLRAPLAGREVLDGAT